MLATALDLTRAAARFIAFSDPTRLAVLERLRGGEHGVCDLQDLLDAEQSRLSFHLRVLEDARAFLANAGVDVERAARELDGRVRAAFVRAHKPAAPSAACCGPTCCA